VRSSLCSVSAQADRGRRPVPRRVLQDPGPRPRFETDGEPTLTSQDVGQIALLSTAHPSALIEIVDREAPFLGSTTPQSSADMWVREVSTAVVNYWRAETIDDFLRIRTEELRRSPTWHWPSPEPVAAEPTDVDESDEGQLGVFISHASEDKADVGRPIAEGAGGGGLDGLA
jgi:hypothetical protein